MDGIKLPSGEVVVSEERLEISAQGIEISHLKEDNQQLQAKITQLKLESKTYELRGNELNAYNERFQAEIADLKEANEQCLSLCTVKEDTKEILRLQAENESHLRNIELRAKHNEKLQTENEKLKEFARHVIQVECWSIDEQDGWDIQDLAEKLGLIIPRKATEEDVDEESDFEVGDTIYEFTQVLNT